MATLFLSSLYPAYRVYMAAEDRLQRVLMAADHRLHKPVNIHKPLINLRPVPAKAAHPHKIGPL